MGSYGGYVNTHTCSHKEDREMEGFAISAAETKERREEREGGQEERRMTAGEMGPSEE